MEQLIDIDKTKRFIDDARDAGDLHKVYTYAMRMADCLDHVNQFVSIARSVGSESEKKPPYLKQSCSEEALELRDILIRNAYRFKEDGAEDYSRLAKIAEKI